MNSILNYENQRLLDVVDENDNVVDSIARAQVHRLGALHREIHVWMLDENNNIIFQKRGLNRDSAGLLDATAGGHVDQGEDYMEAAIRETEEETGLKVNSSDLILIKKMRGSEISIDPWGTKNHFLRSVYVLKDRVDSADIRREAGIPGVSFQKISLKFLSNLSKNEESLFVPFVLKEEIPLLLKHLDKYPL